jgi:hypothetical protein
VLEAIWNASISARPGDGSKAKIVNNMLAGVNLAAACEAMALAIKLGLDPRTMSEVIGASSGGSWMFTDRMPRVLAGDYAPRAAVEILRKDLAILLETARNERFPALVARAAHALYEDAARPGHGHEDDAALMLVYRTLTGITPAGGRGRRSHPAVRAAEAALELQPPEPGGVKDDVEEFQYTAAISGWGGEARRPGSRGLFPCLCQTATPRNASGSSS